MKQDNIIATQGLTNLFAGQPDMDSTDKKVEFIKTKLREFFNLKNVNFLFGAGIPSLLEPTSLSSTKFMVPI